MVATYIKKKCAQYALCEPGVYSREFLYFFPFFLHLAVSALSIIVVDVFLLLLSNQNHQVDHFVAMVHVWYFCVSMIHQTLTWTTGYVTCAQMLI